MYFFRCIGIDMFMCTVYTYLPPRSKGRSTFRNLVLLLPLQLSFPLPLCPIAPPLSTFTFSTSSISSSFSFLLLLSVTAMADIVKEGKAKHIGLSEASADSIRKANATAPIYCIEQVIKNKIMILIQFFFCTKLTLQGDITKTISVFYICIHIYLIHYIYIYMCI